MGLTNSTQQQRGTPPKAATPSGVSVARRAVPVARSESAPVRREYKILLLGAGDTGKSTLVKQLQVVFGGGFPTVQRAQFSPVVLSHVISNMAALVRGVASPLSSDSATAAGERIVALDDNGAVDSWRGGIPSGAAADLRTLWGDSAIRTALETRSGELQISENARHYFDAIDRLSEAAYVPTDEDVVMAPSHTAGFSETVFTSEATGDTFRVVDVGGQRSERKKWAECFTGVSVVVFCAPLSEYDLQLYEDRTAPRLAESLRLWRDVCRSKWFESSAVCLVLNKKDVFERKIAAAPLSRAIPEYKGAEGAIEPAARFIKDLYLKGAGRTVHSFYACATDPDNIRKVFTEIQDVARSSLKQ